MHYRVRYLLDFDLKLRSGQGCITILYLILWQYQLWSFMFRDTKSNRPLPKKEAFQSIFWYILKWNDGEPTKFGHIFTR